MAAAKERAGPARPGGGGLGRRQGRAVPATRADEPRIASAVCVDARRMARVLVPAAVPRCRSASPRQTRRVSPALRLIGQASRRLHHSPSHHHSPLHHHWPHHSPPLITIHHTLTNSPSPPRHHQPTAQHPPPPSPTNSTSTAQSAPAKPRRPSASAIAPAASPHKSHAKGSPHNGTMAYTPRCPSTPTPTAESSRALCRIALPSSARASQSRPDRQEIGKIK